MNLLMKVFLKKGEKGDFFNNQIRVNNLFSD